MDTAPRPKSTRRIVGMFVCALFVPLSVLTSLAPSGNVAHANGITWESRTSAANNEWSSVTFGKGIFVAVAGGFSGSGNRVMTSPDGITWTSRTSAADEDWNSVTYGSNGLFVAVAGSGDPVRVMTSPDGITWTSRTSPRPSDLNVAPSRWQSVTWGGPSGGQLFVAVADNGVKKVMTSPNGVNWADWTSPEAKWSSVTYGNGTFVAVGDADNANDPRIMTSPDGITWTSRTSPAGGNSISWSSVTYGNGKFVAVGRDSTAPRKSTVMTSTDGENWELFPLAPSNRWRSVTFGNGTFVAVSDNLSERVMTSTNGTSWQFFDAAVNDGWYSVTFGNGKFVAVSEDGSVMTSEATPNDMDDENSGGGTSSGGNNATGNSNAGNNSGSSTSNDPTPGTYTSTVDGKKVDVAVTSDDNGGVTVENKRFNTTFQSSTSGKNNELFLPQGDNLSVRGKGFKPGTRVKVRIPKSNMSIGASTVSDDGSFVSQFTIPRSLRAGTHVMTLQGRDKNGRLISIQTTVTVDKLKKATVKRFRVYSNALSQKLRRQTNRVVKQNPTMTAAHCQGFVKPSKINNPKDIARATKRAKSVCTYIQKRNKGVHTTIGFAASRENRRRVEVSYR